MVSGEDHARLLEAYREHMERYRSELDELKLSGMVNPDFAAATDKATQYEKTALVRLQAMYVKYVTARFRCAISGNHARIAQTHDSLRELEADLDAWFKEHRSFAQRFRERIRKDATASLDIVRLRRKLVGNDNTLSNQRKKIVGESNDRQRAIIATH